MNLRVVVLSVALVGLAGCAATVTRNGGESARAGSESPVRVPSAASSRLVLALDGDKSATSAADWEGFKAEWKENFEAQARSANVAFAMQDGKSVAVGDGTLLRVYIDDYRFLRPGTRYLTGVFGGNAYIAGRLSYADLRTGENFGSYTVNTSSSAWQGVFSPMTNKQIEAIAADVMRQLKAGAPALTASPPR